MRIGIVTTWFERGAAYVSRQFMNVLKETDEVFIYARGGEKYAIGDPKWDLPNVWWGKRDVYMNGVFNSTHIYKDDFLKWIQKTGVEAILFNEQQWMTPVVWAKDAGILSIAYIDYYTEATIPLFDVYDCLICNTKRHAFAFRNHKNVRYIKWGTDIELYKPSKEEREKITFFHSAGMAPIRKGTDILLQAYFNSKKRTEGKLLIHTQVSLAKTIPDQSTIIDTMVNEGSLEIVEGTISAPGLYHKGDVYVYPSRLDGIGLTLMEAIACGMVCITSDNAPMNEFIEQDFGLVTPIDYYYSRIDGYYWPMCVCSIKDLTEQIDSCLSDKIDLSKMKSAARTYAENELDFKKNCKVLHEIINNTTFDADYQRVAEKIIEMDRYGVKRYSHILSIAYAFKNKIKSVFKI